MKIYISPNFLPPKPSQTNLNILLQMKKILSKEVWRGEGDVFIETKVVYACIYIYMARKQNKIQSSIARR